jgi:PIN domain nuclease of toxin-antitoxin system
MRYLLDTHTLLWWIFDDPKLSTTARETIAEPDHEIVVSAASAWEIATKHRIGKLPEAGDIVQQLPVYLRRTRFTELDISVEHALFAGNLPGPHRDPFDRMLIAQARTLNMILITTDPVFHDYGIQVFW